MDFEEIKKLLELGGGRCAIYREGEPGYIVLTASEFKKLFKENKEVSPSLKNISPSGVSEQSVKEDFSGFQIEDDSLDAIKIEDLPL